MDNSLQVFSNTFGELESPLLTRSIVRVIQLLAGVYEATQGDIFKPDNAEAVLERISEYLAACPDSLFYIHRQPEMLEGQYSELVVPEWIQEAFPLTDTHRSDPFINAKSLLGEILSVVKELSDLDFDDELNKSSLLADIDYLIALVSVNMKYPVMSLIHGADNPLYGTRYLPRHLQAGVFELKYLHHHTDDQHNITHVLNLAYQCSDVFIHIRNQDASVRLDLITLFLLMQVKDLPGMVRIIIDGEEIDMDTKILLDNTSSRDICSVNVVVYQGQQGVEQLLEDEFLQENEEGYLSPIEAEAKELDDDFS